MNPLRAPGGRTETALNMKDTEQTCTESITHDTYTSRTQSINDWCKLTQPRTHVAARGTVDEVKYVDGRVFSFEIRHSAALHRYTWQSAARVIIAEDSLVTGEEVTSYSRGRWFHHIVDSHSWLSVR